MAAQKSLLQSPSTHLRLDNTGAVRELIVSGPLATRVKGTGLGLFIVRSVAKRHRGRVWAESEGPGRGSTFVLQLPIAK